MMVEDHAPGAGGTLVYCGNVISHFSVLLGL